MGGKAEGIRSINDRFKIDLGRLSIVWEMEKPKNLYVYVRPMDVSCSGGMLAGGGYRAEGA